MGHDVKSNEVEMAFQKVTMLYEGLKLVFILNFVQLTPNYVKRAFGEFHGMLLQRQAHQTHASHTFQFLQMNMQATRANTWQWHGLLGQRARRNAAIETETNNIAKSSMQFMAVDA